MLHLLKNVLFPKTCLSCGKLGAYICLTCQKQLIFNTEVNKLECGDNVDGVLSVFHYNAVLKKIIVNIKYRLVTDALYELLGLIDLEYLCPLLIEKPIYIQPVPLHRSRYNQRGFNQAELIARWLASKLEGEVVDLIKKVKPTQAQAQLNRAGRLLNTKGAFELKKDQNLGKFRVILVDDVVTTGSTVNAAASVLKAAGVGKIVVFSIARG